MTTLDAQQGTLSPAHQPAQSYESSRGLPISPEEFDLALAEMQEQLSSITGERNDLRKDNFELQVTLYALNGILKDERDARKRVEEAARLDQLTGLLNSEAWASEIENRIAKGEAFGVWVFDLRFFKLVNDTYGHEEGNALLKQYGEFLRTKLRRRSEGHFVGDYSDKTVDDTETDKASRTGGDEFGYVAGMKPEAGMADQHLENGIEDRRSSDVFERMDRQHEYIEEATKEFVESLPEKIKALGFGVAIGLALWDPEHPVDKDTLLKQADEAMYEHKEDQEPVLNTKQIEVIKVIFGMARENGIPLSFLNGRYASTLEKLGITT